MGRTTKEEAAVLADFAAAQGIALRTARNYRAGNRREWQEYIAARAVQPAEAVADATLNDLDRARSAAAAAHSALVRLQSMQAASTDPLTLAALQRAVSDALRAWQRAREDADALAARAGRVVPVENVRRIQSVLVSELGQVFRSLPNMAAAHLLPSARPAHFAAWKKVLPSLETLLRKIDAELESLLVC